MLRATTQNTVASLVLGVACLALPSVCAAATPIQLSGAISGVVADSKGIPQMGATVILLNRQDRQIEKLQTDDRGQFQFAGLFPDFYSIRITLSTFFPALKKSILVRPGERNHLNVSLSTLFSTIQLSYPTAIDTGSLMTEEWKWVLRGASSTRPVLRFIDADAVPADRMERSERSAAFSDTRGIVRVSGGEGPLSAGAGNQADMGTTFAVATSLYCSSVLPCECW